MLDELTLVSDKPKWIFQWPCHPVLPATDSSRSIQLFGVRITALRWLWFSSMKEASIGHQLYTTNHLLSSVRKLVVYLHLVLINIPTCNLLSTHSVDQ
jgi:hypothetical protein